MWSVLKQPIEMLVGKSTKVEVDNMCLSGRVGECLKTKGECGTEVEEKVLTSARRSWVWLLAKRRATWAPETSDPPGLRLDNHGNHVRFLEQKKKTLDMIEIALMAVSFCFQFPSTSINTHFLSWCRLPTARLEDSNPYPSGFSTSFTRSISSISSVAGTFWRIFQAINKLLESSGDPCGGILRKESRWEEKCSHMGGANLRQEEEEENRLEGRPSGAVAHTRSICAHLPPVSHTLVPHCSGGRDPLRSCSVPFLFVPFWPSGDTFFVAVLVPHNWLEWPVKMFYPNPSQAMRWTSLYSNFVFPPSPPSKQQDWDNHYGEFLNLSMVPIILVLAVSRRCEIKCQPKYYKVSLPAPLRALLRENTKWFEKENHITIYKESKRHDQVKLVVVWERWNIASFLSITAMEGNKGLDEKNLDWHEIFL